MYSSTTEQIKMNKNLNVLFVDVIKILSILSLLLPISMIN